jgi:hypothetical protein
MREVISHDLQQLAADLGTWLTAEHGGTRAHNVEVAADFLMYVKHAKSADLLDQLATYAAERAA